MPRKRDPQIRAEGRAERITREAAVLILGVPGRTVLHLAAMGRIPGAAKIGCRWTFNEAMLRAWIRSREDEVAARARRGNRPLPNPAYERTMRALLRGEQPPER